MMQRALKVFDDGCEICTRYALSFMTFAKSTHMSVTYNISV